MSIFIAASALKLTRLRAKTCRHEEVQETGNTVILIHSLVIRNIIFTGFSIWKRKRKNYEKNFENGMSLHLLPFP